MKTSHRGYVFKNKLRNDSTAKLPGFALQNE